MIEERQRHTASGLLMLTIFLVILVVAALGVFRAARVGDAIGVVAFVVVLVVDIFMTTGLFTVAPNQGVVLQLFGAYRGTARDEGLRWAEARSSGRSSRSREPCAAPRGRHPWRSRPHGTSGPGP